MKGQSVTIFNPQKNNAETVRTLRAASMVCQAIVVVTSSIGVFAWAQSLAYKYLPDMAATPYIAFALGVATGWMAGYITDVGFGRILQDVLFRTLASRHPNVIKYTGNKYFSTFQAVETWMKWGLLALLLSMDVASMWVITDPVTRAAGSDASLDVERMRTEMQEKYDAQAKSLQAQAQAHEKAARLEKARIAQANVGLVRLQASGNGWAASELRKKQERATKSDATAKQSFEAAAQNTISEGQKYISARIAEAEQRNRETEERNRANQAIAATMYLIFTVGLKILTIFLRVMIVVSFIAYSYNYSPDVTGDGIIDYNDAEQWAKGGSPKPGNF